jgi:hypothetical protein
MATDYDAPRGGGVDLVEDSLDVVKGRREDAQSAVVDVDDTADVFEPPGADMLDEELSVAVVPIRADEFRCSKCFLIHHRSQLAAQRGDDLVCRECV